MQDWIRHQQTIEKMLERMRFQGTPPNLYDPMNYLLGIGGKRLRPVLTLLACEAMGGEANKAVLPAIGLEVFHNFTLMHDDIMDQAPLRRGHPTVHTKWNTPTAILSGDLMLVKAYELLMHSEGLERIKILELFNQTATEVCEGQQLDMDYSEQAGINVEDYLYMIERKTAVLLGCSLKTGAILAKADDHDADLLYDYGIHMGMGFQLMDDILDVFGDEEAVGKQPGGDIVEDKKTWLLLKTMELADKNQSRELERWIGNPDARPAEKVRAVKKVFEELEIDQQARDLAETYFKRADHLLEAVAVEKEKKKNLKEFAAFLKSRVS